MRIDDRRLIRVSASMSPQQDPKTWAWLRQKVMRGSGGRPDEKSGEADCSWWLTPACRSGNQAPRRKTSPDTGSPRVGVLAGLHYDDARSCLKSPIMRAAKSPLIAIQNLNWALPGLERPLTGTNVRFRSEWDVFSVLIALWQADNLGA